MRMSLVAGVVGLALFAGACTIDVEANPDGSLSVESNITEAQLQDGIDKMIDDPSVEDLNVEFHDGFLTVEGRGPDKTTGAVNTVSFDAALGVVDGRLGVEISEALWNGEPVPQWIVDLWNGSLARELERAGRRHPDSTLQSVVVTDSDITMRWHVETEKSKG